jgi:AcrR family transcriptional regulator
MKQDTKRRTFRYPEDRRRDLMDAAAKVFAQKGLAQTTVADITSAAGVGKGTFYLSFDSKEELLGALKQRFADAMVERTQEYLTRMGGEDLWGLADAMVDSMVAMHFEHREMAHVLALEGQDPHSTPAFAAAASKVQGMIAAGIEAGVTTGTFACRDPYLTAGLLMHALDGYVQHCILYDDAVDEARLSAGMKELVRKALGTGS